MITRIISATVAIIIAIVLLTLSNTVVFNIAIAILSAVMVIELFSAKKLLSNKPLLFLCIGYAFIMPLTFINRLSEFRFVFVTAFIILVFLFFIINNTNMNFDTVAYALATTFLTSSAMCTLIAILHTDKTHGLFYLVMALCGAWLSDSGAYFTGTLLGKHKLCPNISPKKTIEGAIGGAITNAIIFVVIGYFYSHFIVTGSLDVNYILLVILGLVCSLLGVLGDLSASLLKRQCNIKDFGKIMPGHGGVLDRFDSILFVAPFVYLTLQFIEIVK